MCNRHVAQMIADYEAARLDEEETDDSASGDGEQATREPSGLLATLRGRFAR